MENKKSKRVPAVQRTIYVPKEIDEKVLKYMANNPKSMTYSEAINECIKSFLKIHANKDELSITTTIIENTIRKELKPEMERIIKLLAKSTKSGYGSIFILGQVLAYMFNTDDEKEFLKNVIEKSEAMGYKAVKNYSLKEDIEKMFPKSMKSEDF